MTVMKSSFIKFEFTKEKLGDLTRVFQDTPPDTLVSRTNMARCIDKMEGNHSLGFTYFKELIGKSGCDDHDKVILSDFYSQTSASLDALNLMTEASQKYFFLEIQKRCDKIKSFSDIKSENPTRVKLESIDLSYRQICTDRFDLFTSTELTPLKNILLSMEHFPEQTYVLIYPYLGSLLELSVFTACFHYFSDNLFFESLFRHSVERIELSNHSFGDTVPYRHSRSLFFGAIVSSSLVSALFGYYYCLGTKVVVLVPASADALDPYKFTGQLGEVIKAFEENSGAVLYTACNICATYAEIFVLTLIEPYEGLGNDLKDLYCQMY